MKYFVFVALIIVSSGIWWFSSAGQISFFDEHTHEIEFIDTADSPAIVSTEPTEYPEASSSLTYLPPIPEPTNPDGRTRWAAYWEPMTAEEYAVYGRTERPDGPPRVGIQVGHWQRENLPEELSGLTGSSGANAGGYTEEEVNLAVAEEVVKLLTAAGVEATLLPVTVPIDYLADAFVSIHADGNTDTSISGFKIAPPRVDYSGRAQKLVDAMNTTYKEATKLQRDDAFTRRMSGYYAFNWRRYDHAVHPQTPSAIVEMGFLTNANDRAFMTSQPAIVAEGIAKGIINYLTDEGLLTTE